MESYRGEREQRRDNSPSHLAREWQRRPSLVLSTAGLCLSVLVARSKGKVAPSMRSRKTADAKIRRIQGWCREHRSSWRKRPRLQVGPARAGPAPEIVAHWAILAQQHACLP